MTIIMRIFSGIVKPEVAVAFLIICMIVAKDKLDMFLFFIYAAFMTNFMMVLKSCFHHPRSYMVNTNIIPLQKFAEYGNPSGHVLMGYVIVTYFFERWIYCHELWMYDPYCTTNN